ncbi:AsmA family protein [Janthinobacterium sp. PC23-8]|uniref:AsmA family protein n=1 Tax=Janthinobacterium sp. PC23-8 TaxID=2012679 RepID=UPI000B97B911|nr:AsmA family protein [Janthinobacterium sp. PC23-8]OYO25797.1 AsmA family protein [Janthinobacterium sp. PC23-8]
MPHLPLPKSRRAKIVLAAAGLLVAVPAVAIVVLINADWNRARPWLNARTSEALGRPFVIDGDLTLTWQQPAAAPGRHGWRDYLPWPHLQAQNVRMGNPVGITPDPAHPDAASVSRLAFSLNPLALLQQKIVIPELRFDSPDVRLLRGKDGNNNWTFEKQKPDSKWEFQLQSVVFSKGTVYLTDGVTDTAMRADVDTIADSRYGIAWRLAGTYRGAPVKGSGKAGGVLSLQQQGTPFPLQAEMHSGGTMLAIDGTLTRPTQLAALDVLLKIAGPSMAQLYPLTGVLLPETPPFSAQGRLTGVIKRGGGDWVYDKFSGKVGSSDISGKMTFSERKPRNFLTGNVHSRLLQFSDLGPLVGADNRASKEQRGARYLQPAGRVLPVEAFRTERWTSLDADVRYTADQITRDADLPISQVDTHIVLQDSVLSLNPLNFNIAGGTLATQIRLDGSGRTLAGGIAAELKASARHMQIRQLFPRLPPLQASVGQINGDAALTATGNSVASLLGNANGEVKALINGGSISKLLLEEMGLNIGSVVLAKLSGDKQVKLNCMAADFGVTHGLMQTRQFIVDTDDATLHVDGTVNLENERLDLTLRPDSKGVRIFSLRSPLYVKGTFSDPDVSVDKGVLALRAGGALALAAVAPFAALLPLVNAGPGEQSECAALLNQAGRKPVAPPPGKARARQGAKPTTGERAVPR